MNAFETIFCEKAYRRTVSFVRGEPKIFFFRKHDSKIQRPHSVIGSWRISCVSLFPVQQSMLIA